MGSLGLPARAALPFLAQRDSIRSAALREDRGHEQTQERGSPDAHSHDGTGLIRAADRGFAKIARRLLATELDVDHVNRLGWTALLEAVILGDGGARHQAIVGLLIEHGADVDLADRDGVTPLAHARARGYRPIEALLTAAGARA